MHIVLLSLTLLFQTAVSGEGTKDLPLSPTLANTKLVSDYRAFGKLERNYSETPLESFSEDWREAFKVKPRAKLEAELKTLPGLTSWKLRGIDDGANTPSLRLAFATMLDLEAPILEFQYQPQFHAQLEILIRYLGGLPTKEPVLALTKLQLKWSEEVLLPPDFVLATPLAGFQKTYGLVALHRTVKRQPGRVVIELNCSLTQERAAPAELEETVAALKLLPADPPLTFQANVLDALATEAVIPAMKDLRDQTADPELRAWATIQRAAAFQELFLPQLGVALLDAALAKSPDDADLLRARVMLGLPLRQGMAAGRQQMIACLERLLKHPPLDARRLRLELAKYLCQANLDESEPSLEELKRGTELMAGLGPEAWDRNFFQNLVTLGDFETIERLLAASEANGAADRQYLRMSALAGRHKGQELDQLLGDLEPDGARRCLEQVYRILVASSQVEALRFLSEHARTLLEPKQLTEIEGAVREARVLPSSSSPEGMYRQWLRAISLRDRGAIDRLVRPEALALDRAFFEKRLEGELKDRSLKWPFGVGELKLEGDPDTGYRLEADSTTYYFTGNQEGYRLVTMDRTLHLAGQYVLDLLDQGKLTSAFQWLDWYYKQEGFRIKWMLESASFWNDQVPRTEENARLAAQVMALTGPGRERALPATRAAFEEATGTLRDELALLFILTDTELDDWLLAADFTPSAPSPGTMVVGFWQCSIHGQCSMLEEMCAGKPDDLTCELMTKGLTGGYAALLAAIETLEGEAWKDEYGEMLLHFALMEPVVPEVPDRYLPEQRQPDLLNYYAERGMTEALLFTLSDWQGRPTNQSLENYLLGRMAEAFSEPDLARIFYAKVEKPTLILSQLEGNYRLAKKHQDRLGSR